MKPLPARRWIMRERQASRALRFSILALFIILVAGVGQDALAVNVLVFGDDFRKDTVAADLTAMGKTVTNVGPLPASLSGFDTIWAFQIVSALSASQLSQLSSFLAADKGLYITGERPCCDAANTSYQTLLNSVVVGDGITVGNQGDVSDSTFSFNPGALGGITTTPNMLTAWFPVDPGKLAGVSGSHVLATGNLGTVVGGVWQDSDLVGGQGRIALLMDIDWISNTCPACPSSRVATVQNIETYLEAGGVPAIPEPGTLLLLGSGLLGAAGFGWRRRRRQ